MFLLFEREDGVLVAKKRMSDSLCAGGEDTCRSRKSTMHLYLHDLSYPMRCKRFGPAA
jgi:hypothetical protein